MKINAIMALLVAVLMVGSALAVISAGENSSFVTQNHFNINSLAQVSGAAPANFTSVEQYELIPEASAYNLNAQISVTVGFKPQGNMYAFTQSLYTANSPFYRKFVTTAQLGSMFGVPVNEYDSIAKYFENYGLNVLPSNDRLSMQLSGTPSQIDNAFHTVVQPYAMQYQSNGMWNPMFGNSSSLSNLTFTSPLFYLAKTPLELPDSMTSYVSDVIGLNGAMETPDLLLPYGLSPGSVSANSTSDWPFSSSTNVSMYQNITQANYMWVNDPELYSMYGANEPYQFLFPSTMHILTGAENLWDGRNTISSAPDMGQGVTIAVIEVGSIPMSWLQNFAQQVWNNPDQITDRLSVISLFGANVQTGYDYGWSAETALDIEYIAAMAPLAHIDLIALPSSALSMFDYSYAYIAQYLTTGANATDSVTITSNSYGTEEVWALFFGPNYITVENTLLESLNSVGVTNFFASGDDGATPFIASDIPAMAHGSTSVGGGMATAESNGQEFPVTSTFFNDAYGYPVYVAPATGLASFTYWSYYYGYTGTYMGLVGGGFGQSISEQQPWWQNALDTYSSGAAIDPVVSGPAAFNMTVYAGEWIGMYGGTSFATPITAGEWALIEEQADVAFGTPAMGDINPMLYAVHNAYQANVYSAPYDPYVAMTNIGNGFDWAPYNAYAWYEINTTGSVVDDPILPVWFATIDNPAGSGWNYLQGLGMIEATYLDNELIGQTPSTQHALMNEPFAVLQVTASGLKPITTLVGGDTYTFQIVLADGLPGNYYAVRAYSDDPNNGAYGGGVITTIYTGSNGTFTYTPEYNLSVPSQSASEYGYFYVVSASSTDWTFQQFAVEPVNASGSLVLGVTDSYGRLQTAVAEVPSYQSVLGSLSTEGEETNFGPIAQVMLNGQPVSGAVVKEISINNSQYLDPTMPASSYAPGAVLGQFLTGGRGIAHFYTDAALSEMGGLTTTQVEELVATYNGLTSNPVIVYCEPDMGSFNANVHLNSAGTALVGNVTFSGMRYVNYVNISIGYLPGQYVNVSYPPTFYDSQAQIYESGVYDGFIPVNFTNLPKPGAPINVSMVAEGSNDESFILGIPNLFTITSITVQNPIIWSDPIIIKNPGPAPTAKLYTDAGSVVNGTVPLLYSGSWDGYTPVIANLTVMSPAGIMTLASNVGLNGTYDWNTSPMLDGYYNVTYTVTTGTGLTASSSLIFYTDNMGAVMEKEIVNLTQKVTNESAQLQYLMSLIQSDNHTIAYLQGLLNNANSTIINLTARISALRLQVSNLTAQLNFVTQEYQNTYAELNETKTELSISNAQVSALRSQLNMSNSTILALKSEIGTDNIEITNLTAMITELNNKIVELQNSLNSRKNYVPGAWYDIFGGAGVVILAILVIIGIIIGYFAGRHQKKPPEVITAPEEKTTEPPESKSSELPSEPPEGSEKDT